MKMKEGQTSSSDESENDSEICQREIIRHVRENGSSSLSPNKHYKNNTLLSFSESEDSIDQQSIDFLEDAEKKEESEIVEESSLENIEDKVLVDTSSQTIESSFDRLKTESSESSDSESEKFSSGKIVKRRNSEAEKTDDEPLYNPKKMRKGPKDPSQLENSDENEFLHFSRKPKEITAEQTMLLRRMVIKLDHEVPPQHKVESRCGGMTPKPGERKEFEKYVKMRRGSFDPEEDNLIVRNWGEFCKLNGWDHKIVEPFLKWRHDGRTYFIPCLKERKKFVQFLAKDLNNRSLYSVFHRFKLLHSGCKNGRYSKEEDDHILDYVSNHPNVADKFSRIGKKLKRSRYSVYCRYKLLANDRRSP